MQQKTTPIIAIILLLLVIGGSAYWYSQNKDVIQPIISPPAATEATGTDIAATLAYQQGDVQVIKDGSDWQTIATDTVLHQGDSVKTGADSKAILEFENSDVVRLGYSTEIFLTGLKSHQMTITQLSGASYNRVVKNTLRVYQVKTGEVTVQALGTAFDVMDTDEAVDVNVVENKVKVITGEDQEEVGEGESAKVDKDENTVDVTNMNPSELNNDWYKWNKEEDSKKTDNLGILSEYAGPELTIIAPNDGAEVGSDKVTVMGTVNDFEAKLTVNDNEVENQAGQFSYEVELAAGKNVITVIAEDAEGNRTIKEVKVYYQVAVLATPIELTAETQTDGVHLSWNESTGATFQYYKVVRSETNPDLKYPDDGYIARKDKGQESYVDTDASADKTYYYRVCEVMSGEKVFCSNVAHMAGKEVVEPQPTTNTNTGTNINTQPTPESGITLSATAETDGVHLSWTVTGLTIEHGFKVVKDASANPVFPGNDYKYIDDSPTKSYTWPLTDGQTYHFRVCQYSELGKCLAYSNDVEIIAYELTSEDVGLSLSAKAEDDGVGLWWTDVASISGFKYYKVVRSETNANLRYPDDSYIAAKSKHQESHRDYSAVNGTSYYYRICAVGDSTYCSNVVQVTAIHENPAPAAVTLLGAYSGGSVVLNWSQSGERDFKYYKIVWSQTNSAPVYPTDGYIKAESTVHNISFSDDGSKISSRTSAVDLSTGTHYYSVCVVDSLSQVTCSNTVTLVDGVVQ